MFLDLLTGAGSLMAEEHRSIGAAGLPCPWVLYHNPCWRRDHLKLTPILVHWVAVPTGNPIGHHACRESVAKGGRAGDEGTPVRKAPPDGGDCQAMTIFLCTPRTSSSRYPSRIDWARQPHHSNEHIMECSRSFPDIHLLMEGTRRSCLPTSVRKQLPGCGGALG